MTISASLAKKKNFQKNNFPIQILLSLSLLNNSFTIPFIYSGPRPPQNLRRISLTAPESKTQLKVAWDPPDDSYVDFYK